MNLTIDIGNTTVTICFFKTDRVVKVFSFPCDSNITKRFHRIKFPKNYNIELVGISSVVPNFNHDTEKFIKRYFRIKPLFINSRINLPIKLKIKNQLKLGADRIAAASAGYIRFEKNENVIIVDTGTANTFDVVSKEGAFLGGAISPGMNMNFSSLHSKTALLPILKIKNIKKKIHPIGNDTASAIISGVFYSYIDGINSMITRIKSILNNDCKIIITGGYSALLKKYLLHKAEYHRYLVSEGINYILNLNYDKVAERK